MRITQIDFEGKPGYYATATRRREADRIEVTILAEAIPGGQRDHSVQADSEEDIYSMADCLHFELEGYKGTNSEIHEYYRELLKMSDC